MIKTGRAQVSKFFWRSYFSVYNRLNRSLPYQRLLSEVSQKTVASRTGDFLDIGCGTGNSTYALATILGRSGQVVGVDNSVFALEVARERFLGSEYANLTFVGGNIDQPLSFANESFEGVLANNVVYLVKDPVQTLCEVMRVLKPGGRFVMTNPKQGASPLKIFTDHLRLKKEQIAERYGRVAAGAMILPHAVSRVVDFLLLLPFQLVLRSGKSFESRFWSGDQWRDVLAEVSRKTTQTFAIEEEAVSYSGQNTTFTLVKQ
jgi:ubiquinone/menaquinone biosynthesis C-methylase UbiE